MTSAVEDPDDRPEHDEAPHDDSQPGELIEPGRALALGDFSPPEVSAGERLVRLAYRMGVPGEALRSPFRRGPKPRLLATVSDPLPGHRAAGNALLAG
ncbi:MAG: heparinase, partial [Novosphingobium sp.]